MLMLMIINPVAGQFSIPLQIRREPLLYTDKGHWYTIAYRKNKTYYFKISYSITPLLSI